MKEAKQQMEINRRTHGAVFQSTLLCHILTLKDRNFFITTSKHAS